MLKKVVGSLILVFVFVLIFPTSTKAATYYVSTTGNDSNAGSQSSPWKTIQKAAGVVSAGDTVNVTSGDYSTSEISITRSGTSSNPITFRAQGSVKTRNFYIRANYVTIDGFDITNKARSDRGGINITGNGCKILNNYVHQTALEGIYVNNGSSGCQVINNKVYQACMAGIGIDGTGHTVSDNEVWGTFQYKDDQCSPAFSGSNCTNPLTGVSARCGSDADGFRFWGSNHTFRGNYIHDISYNNSNNQNPHTDGFQTWNAGAGAGHDSLFENNIIDIYGTTTAGFQLEGTHHDLTIKNNVITGVIGVFSYPNSSTKHTIINNTIISDRSYTGSTVHPAGVQLDASDNIVKNNIIMNVYGSAFKTSASSSGYNLIWNVNGNGTTLKSTDITGRDPLLNSCWRPASNSPVCTAGEGGTYIGAYPCGNTACSGTPPPTNPTASPAPTFNIADLDQDGDVDDDDYNKLVLDFGKIGANGFIRSDIIKNGVVDIFDFNKLIANYGN